MVKGDTISQGVPPGGAKPTKNRWKLRTKVLSGWVQNRLWGGHMAEGDTNTPKNPPRGGEQSSLRISGC